MTVYEVKFTVDAGGAEDMKEDIRIVKQIETDAAFDEVEEVCEATLNAVEEEVGWVFAATLLTVEQVK